MTSFKDLELIEPLLRAVAEEGYETPTPIQEQAIPFLLDGFDLIGCAQTGTGKTAAFALPILQFLAEDGFAPGHRHIKCLVLSPTRELAAQIDVAFKAYARFLKFRSTVIFGGVNQRSQVAELRRGIEILVATPGRLLDLHGQGHIDFNHVEFFILDEADRMLDMGFIHDIRRVLKVLPEDRQNLLFSATMPPSIVRLASSFLFEPKQVSVKPESTPVELIEQRIMFVEKANKRHLITELLKDPEVGVERALVFTRTKHGANRVVQHLERAGIGAAAIHGNKSQNARNRAMDGFRNGSVAILVATDIASRGIDVEGITHVFNFDLPNEPESYVHRIGRTGRAGREGVAISFCDQNEGDYLRDIERLTGVTLTEVLEHPYHFPAAIPAPLRPSHGRRREQPARSQRSRSAPGQQRQSSRGRRPESDRTPSAPSGGNRRRRPAPASIPRSSNSGQTDNATSGQPRSSANAPAKPSTPQRDDGPARPRRRRRGGSSRRPSTPRDPNPS